MFVKHHDLLSRRASILHSALASVIWPSATLIVVDRFLQLYSAKLCMILVQMHRNELLYWEWVVCFHKSQPVETYPFEVELYT